MAWLVPRAGQWGLIVPARSAMRSCSWPLHPIGARWESGARWKFQLESQVCAEKRWERDRRVSGRFGMGHRWWEVGTR